jgi:branched-chain amino acid transport system permease protein
MKQKKLKTAGAIAASFVVIILLEQLIQPTDPMAMLLTVIKKGAIYSLVAVSMNLLNGFTGLFSLGQAGFMLLGSYTYAIFTIPLADRASVYRYYDAAISLSFPEALEGVLGGFGLLLGVLIAILLAGLAAALAAFLIGLPVLRLRSDYLAIATLGFAEIIQAILGSRPMDTITNGSYGLNKIPGFASILTPFIIAFLCILVMVFMIRSSYGRAFKAIREDEIAAEAMGVNLLKHKEMSFVTSSFFTAIAGGMLAMFMRSIDSKTFSITLTYDILLIVVIGGLGSVSGSILGAFLVTASKEWWLRFFDQPLNLWGWDVPLFRTGFRMVIFSLLLMVVVLFYRRGLMGSREFNWNFLFPSHWKRIKRLSARIRKGRETSSEGGDAHE